MATTPPRMGAILEENDRCTFTVWGPYLDAVELLILTPQETQIPLKKLANGAWSVTVEGVTAGTRYLYSITQSGKLATLPDPASRYQPEGVHGPSAVIATNHDWGDGGWRNLPLHDYVIYELHVGAFTPAGTFAAIIERLADLKALGVTAIELMPVAQFPGDRNWGYDGVFPYAVQNSYGGASELKQLVDACHQHGLAVILDVVYNHFGPEGNYTGFYGPYITEKYQTPWGGAINFDDAWSDGVRAFFQNNVLYWLQEFHLDALRLDAIHAIYDFSAQPFLAEVATVVKTLSETLGKPHYLIAESDLNDSRIIRPSEQGGYGLDAQWSDDFHHALHTLLTGETDGYYSDFGSCEALAIAIRQRFVYDGAYSSFRRRRHGNSVSDRPATQFVVCAQNHDQIGNQMLGQRLTEKISYEALKLAAGAVITSPYLPLLFMGEEYGETAPFLYFIDHSDSDLVQAVAEGRQREFAQFQSQGGPPPAHTIDTFEQAILNWELRQQGHHQVLWRYYQQLLTLRKQLGLNAPSLPADLQVHSDEATRVVWYQRRLTQGQLLCLMNFNAAMSAIAITPADQSWQCQIDSASDQWGGPGSSLPAQIATLQQVTLAPHSFALYWSE